MQKMGNVPPIPDCNLLIGIENRCIYLGRIFELNDTYRQAINEQKDIWNSGLGLAVIGVFNSKLVYSPVDVDALVSKSMSCTILASPSFGANWIPFAIQP